MMPSRCVVVASICAGLLVCRAADATTPVDYTERNVTFAPEATVKPAAQVPAMADAVQNKRVTPGMVDKRKSPLGERRSSVEMAETREKNVRPKSTQTPEAVPQVRSRMDQKRANITVSNTITPPVVTKYQESLTAATAANMASYPALDGATTAKLNRFVFRKNAAEPADSPIGAPVVPAAGGSAIRK